MRERVFWSDGELIHVAHLGWQRIECFCEVTPVTSKTLQRPLDINARIEATPTCLECTTNEGRVRCRP